MIEDIFDFVEIPRDSLDEERILNESKRPPLPPKPEAMKAKPLDEIKSHPLNSSMPELNTKDIPYEERNPLRSSAPQEVNGSLTRLNQLPGGLAT